jgi:uncharacterized membrane protein
LSPMVFWLSIIGLLISIIGSVILYKGTPVDNGKVKSLAGLIVWEEEPDIAKKEKGIKIRQNLSQIGFILLIAGFAIQFIAVILQAP